MDPVSAEQQEYPTPPSGAIDPGGGGSAPSPPANTIDPGAAGAAPAAPSGTIDPGGGKPTAGGRTWARITELQSGHLALEQDAPAEVTQVFLVGDLGPELLDDYPYWIRRSNVREVELWDGYPDDPESSQMSFQDYVPTSGAWMAGIMITHTPSGHGVPQGPDTSIAVSPPADPAAPAGTPVDEGAGAPNGDPGTVDPMVMAGEQSPVSPAPLPEPVSIDHTTPLDDQANYRVSVGGRGAPATVVLPDPPAHHQWVEVIDASLQADAYPVTVDPGGQLIEGHSGSFTINQAGGVLEMYYIPSAGWKVI